MARTPVSMRVATIPAATGYQAIPASSTATVLGASGAVGDIITNLICVVATAATAQVQIKDGTGGTNIVMLPNSPGGGIGAYPIPLGVQSSVGGWYVTTGAGVSVIATGQFT